MVALQFLIFMNGVVWMMTIVVEWNMKTKKKSSRGRESDLNAARKLKESGLLYIIVLVVLVFMIIIAYMIVMCIYIYSFGIGTEWKWNYCANFPLHKCYHRHPQNKCATNKVCKINNALQNKQRKTYILFITIATMLSNVSTKVKAYF